MEKNTQTFFIRGMTCASCEVIIERKLKKIDGVSSVEVSKRLGKCTIITSPEKKVHKDDIARILADTEYRIVHETETTDLPFNWVHIIKIGTILLVVYFLMSAFGLFSFDTALGERLSYPTIFGIGLIASVSSCIAVVGGLVLTFTATVKRMNPSVSRWHLLRSHVLFNGGRIVSYFFLGGAVALLGAALAPSPRVMGLISLFAAFVMIVLALDLLGLSGSKKWIPRMPKKLSHWIYDMAESQKWWIPFFLGALTFFLPCGFTQSMQIYALTTGSFLTGALVLFVFSLGTLPTLLAIGAFSSMVSSRGPVYRWFMLVAGSFVLLLGLYNAKSSLNLLGLNVSGLFASNNTESLTVASEIKSGVQVVNMAIQGIKYVPDTITIQKGIPVEWLIDGSRASGCTSVITVPSMGITQRVASSGKTVIKFTPKKVGRLSFTCGMGMAYGEFNVVESVSLPPSRECDPTIQVCVNQ